MTDKHALPTPPGAALQGLDDLAALAAFLWAIVVTVGLWRARKDG